MPVNHQKVKTDLSREEYQSCYSKGDGTKVAEITKELGLNKGKGYDNTYCYSIIAGTRHNQDIWNIYKEMIKGRLINQYAQTKRIKLVQQFESMMQELWPKVVAEYTKE